MAISGVNKNLYQNYSFNDHIWTHAQTARPDLLELSNRCIKFKETYIMKLANTNTWVDFGSMVDAKKNAMNTWLHGRLTNGSQISTDLINTFFDGTEETSLMINSKAVKTKTNVGSCPYVQGKMVIPYGPQYLKYKGLPYINVAETNVTNGDVDYVDIGKAILLMVYRSLCDGPQLASDPNIEADLLLAQVLSNSFNQLEFRFVMNWLAAIVQQPGINLQTNLWLIGQQQGIGKGTLIDVMKAIIGANLVGCLNQTEIERGWNDHLFGKALIEVNEFDTETSQKGSKYWDKWIKAHTCETELPICVRNGTSYTTLNIGNYIFTSNDENPMFMDASDRRNMVVKTTDDPYWKDFASQIKVTCVNPRIGDVAKGFSWILEQVQVDMPLIMSAPMTLAKNAIQTAHVSRVEEWAATDSMIQRNTWSKASVCLDRFRCWIGDNYPKESLSETEWGREMTKIVGKKLIEKKRGNDGQYYQFPDVIAKPAAVSMKTEAADALGKIVGETVEVVDNDCKIALPEPPKKMTAMERMRAELIKGEGVNVVAIR